MNDKEERILNLANSLHIFETKTISDITNLTYALAYKYLGNIADIQKIEKHKGFWRLPDCKSEYGEHAQYLTKSLATILKTPYQHIIYREKTISEVGLRPDALVMLLKEGAGRCFIFEEVNNENENYLAQKINTWKVWEGARDYLSHLFKYDIPNFDIITSDELKDYLEGL